MTGSGQRKKIRDKVRQHRDRLRQQGLRPVQLWLPDLRKASFAEDVSRQCAIIAASAAERDDQAFLESVADIVG